MELVLPLLLSISSFQFVSVDRYLVYQIMLQLS